MSITVVNDYYFKPDGDVAAGKAAATELVQYFTSEVPGVQLSLWLESRENPLHHFHITVFDGDSDLERLRKSETIKRFIDKLHPHIDHSTFVWPVCKVWLLDGAGTQKVSSREGRGRAHPRSMSRRPHRSSARATLVLEEPIHDEPSRCLP